MAKAANNSRYERKFYITELSRFEVEDLLRLHPGAFSQIYYERPVNNIYFDSPAMKNYFDNVNGSDIRMKTRIRWYGDLFAAIENPRLELKIKHGWLGRKESFDLCPFMVDHHLTRTTLMEVFQKSQLPEDIKLHLNCIEFSLMNRYRRKYFQSADGRYRITIDFDLEFYDLSAHHNTFINKSAQPHHVILELKYDQHAQPHAHHITNQFPFRLTKSSKYTQGLERLNAW